MAQPFCPRCGAAQDSANVFCPKCGLRLPGEEPQEAAREAVPREATAEAPNATMPVAQSPVVDDLWFRLRAEEQEYTRRSRRNARVGCLVLLVLAVAFVAAIWQWGLTAP